MRTFMENQVVTLKLSSGEEVIGRVVKQTENTLTLKNTQSMTVMHNGVGMTPYLFTADTTAETDFNINLIISTTLTEKSIADEFVSKVTGIVTKTSGLII